jgi:hypothetical protein
MAMAKKVERRTTGCIYGITPRDKVQSVWVERKGKSVYLKHYEGAGYQHLVHPSNLNNPLAEAALVFHLTDAFEVPIALVDTEHTKARISELEEKAAKRREARDKESAKEM